MEGGHERERETRGEKQFGSARGRGRRTSNGATKLILQNAAFRSGKLLRSTSWRVRPCFRGRRRRGVNRFAAVSSRVTTVPNRDAAWSPRKFRPRGLSRGERGKILHGGRVQLFLPRFVKRPRNKAVDRHYLLISRVPNARPPRPLVKRGKGG